MVSAQPHSSKCFNPAKVIPLLTKLGEIRLIHLSPLHKTAYVKAYNITKINDTKTDAR